MKRQEGGELLWGGSSGGVFPERILLNSIPEVWLQIAEVFCIPNCIRNGDRDRASIGEWVQGIDLVVETACREALLPMVMPWPGFECNEVVTSWLIEGWWCWVLDAPLD